MAKCNYCDQPAKDEDRDHHGDAYCTHHYKQRVEDHWDDIMGEVIV